MREVLALIAITLVSQASAAELRVDDVPVTGALKELSVSDLHDAIIAFESSRYEKPAKLEVISNSEIHAYLQVQDLGWMPLRRVPVVRPPDFNPAPHWMVIGRSILLIPEALRVIGAAQEVYVFPVTTPRKPHLDEKHLRLLDPEASGKLKRLLSDERNWLHGSYDLIWPRTLPTDVGLLFRQDKNEVVLFFPFGQGTFNGENTGGALGAAAQDFAAWKGEYAQPELAARCCPAVAPDVGADWPDFSSDDGTPRRPEDLERLKRQEQFDQQYRDQKLVCGTTGKVALIIPRTPNGDQVSFTCVSPKDPRYEAQHLTEPEPPHTNLAPLLQTLVGQNVEAAASRLGGPPHEPIVDGNFLYTWSFSTVYAVPHTTLRDEERTKGCSIRLAIDPATKTITQLFAWTEKRGGCQTFAERLMGRRTP